MSMFEKRKKTPPLQEGASSYLKARLESLKSNTRSGVGAERADTQRTMEQVERGEFCVREEVAGTVLHSPLENFRFYLEGLNQSIARDRESIDEWNERLESEPDATIRKSRREIVAKKEKDLEDLLKEKAALEELIRGMEETDPRFDDLQEMIKLERRVKEAAPNDLERAREALESHARNTGVQTLGSTKQSPWSGERAA